MQAKFILGFMLGIVVGAGTVVGGGFFYLMQTGANPGGGLQANAPAVQVGKGDRVDQLLTRRPRAPGEPGLAEVRMSLKLPSHLASKLPPEFSASLQMTGLSNSNSFIEPIVTPLISKRDLIFSVNPPEIPEGELRFTLFICPARGQNICDGSRAIFSTRTWAKFDRNKTLVDLGVLPLSRYIPPAENCAPDVLLAGEIVPTETYLKTAKEGPKAFALISLGQGARNAPTLARSSADGEIGAGAVYFKFDSPPESVIKHAALIDPRKGHVAFSVPSMDIANFTYLPVVVDCKPGEDAKSCARNAFPVPASLNTIPGRVTKLIAKDYVIPRCGMKNATLFLHNYSKAAEAVSAADAKLPPEVKEGANYF